MHIMQRYTQLHVHAVTQYNNKTQTTDQCYTRTQFPNVVTLRHLTHAHQQTHSQQLRHLTQCSRTDTRPVAGCTREVNRKLSLCGQIGGTNSGVPAVIFIYMYKTGLTYLWEKPGNLDTSFLKYYSLYDFISILLYSLYFLIVISSFLSFYSLFLSNNYFFNEFLILCFVLISFYYYKNATHLLCFHECEQFV